MREALIHWLVKVLRLHGTLDTNQAIRDAVKRGKELGRQEALAHPFQSVVYSICPSCAKKSPAPTVPPQPQRPPLLSAREVHSRWLARHQPPLHKAQLEPVPTTGEVQAAAWLNYDNAPTEQRRRVEP